MERTDYLKLRFDVQQELTSGMSSHFLDVDDLVSSVMRIFLRSLSDCEVKRQRASRRFKTFRRNPETTVPSWAYRKPGIRSRLPTL